VNETQARRRGHAFLPPAAELAEIPALYATDGITREEHAAMLLLAVNVPVLSSGAGR
jgi:hypothetical protein